MDDPAKNEIQRVLQDGADESLQIVDAIAFIVQIWYNTKGAPVPDFTGGCAREEPMIQASEAIERFFRSYESNLATNDMAEVVSQFAHVFIAASPQGAQPVSAADFALAVPRRKQLFDRIGCRSSELLSLREQPLDARYVLADTEWKMTFARTEGDTEEVVVDSVFILDTGAPSPKIILYLARHDIMQVLKDRGLLPASSATAV